jgi:4'-phosphopantetheinyl transferase
MFTVISHALLPRIPGGQSTEEFFRTMCRNFTEGEWSHILAPPTHQQQLAVFYRFWCLKESFIKAEGSGLSYGLQRLEFSPDPTWPPSHTTCCSGSVLAIDGHRVSDWRFEESLIDKEHCVSVAVRGCRGDKATPTFSEVGVSDLLSQLEPLTSKDHTHWTNFVSRQK